MIVQMQIEMTGAVPSKFTINDYTEDCVKVSGLVPFAEEDGGFGRGAEVFNYKTSKDITEFENFGFDKGSVLADCKVEIVKRGKKTVMILRDLKPVKQLSTTAKP